MVVLCISLIRDDHVLFVFVLSLLLFFLPVCVPDCDFLLTVFERQISLTPRRVQYDSASVHLSKFTDRDRPLQYSTLTYSTFEKILSARALPHE